MKRKIKCGLKGMLANSPGFLAIAAWYTRYTPKILMMHRFCRGPQENMHAMAGPVFERQLRFLDGGKWNVISLRQYLELRTSRRPVPPYTVILTIDDGYRDFYAIAYPLLKKHNLPATFFVTTRFVDGDFWLWHDRIDYALRTTRKQTFQLDFPDARRSFTMHGDEDIHQVWQALSDHCVSVPNREKWATIRRLEETLHVSPPSEVPLAYAAATWAHLREMAADGIEIGAHSVSHPILSKISPENLANEIAGSKNAIESELRQPVVSFCYPNGQEEDINNQVVAHVQKAGFSGATYGCHLDFSDLYKLPRMGIGNDMVDFRWKVSGLEMLLNHHRNKAVS